MLEQEAKRQGEEDAGGRSKSKRTEVVRGGEQNRLGARGTY